MFHDNYTNWYSSEVRNKRKSFLTDAITELRSFDLSGEDAYAELIDKASGMHAANLVGGRRKTRDHSILMVLLNGFLFPVDVGYDLLPEPDSQLIPYAQKLGITDVYALSDEELMSLVDYALANLASEKYLSPVRIRAARQLRESVLNRICLLQEELDMISRADTEIMSDDDIEFVTEFLELKSSELLDNSKHEGGLGFEINDNLGFLKDMGYSIEDVIDAIEDWGLSEVMLNYPLPHADDELLDEILVALVRGRVEIKQNSMIET